MAYRYTQGQTDDIENFGDQYIDITDEVTAENFDEMVKEGLWELKPIAVPKDADNLLIRYYNPQGELIESNNIPVVVDGTGIKAITDYWAVSQTDVKPAAARFTSVLKNPDSVNRYLWKFSVIEYTDGTTDGSYEDAVITGVYGKDGKDGTSAKYVEIDTPEGVAFVNGSPSVITLRAICTGFTPSSYKWFKNGTELTGKTQSYLEVTTEGVYKVEVDGQYEDTQSVVAVKDGEDAYTVVIDNENIHVPTNNTGYTTSELSYYVTVDVYRGTKTLNNIKAYTELGDDDFYVTLFVGDNAITSVVADRTQGEKKVYNTFKITIPENTHMDSSTSITVDVRAKNTVSMRKYGQLVPAKAGAKGDKGDEGEQGERGAEYLGCFARNDLAYDSRNGNLVADDFYLNSTDGYIYVAIKNSSSNSFSWGQVSSYSDTRYKQAMNDMIAIAGSDRSEQFMFVVNLWVKNLTVQTALIQELFAKNVTVKSQLTVDKLKATNAEIEGEITATKGELKNLDVKGILSFPDSEDVVAYVDYSNPDDPEINYKKPELNSNGTIILPNMFVNTLEVNESGIFSPTYYSGVADHITFSHSLMVGRFPEKYLVFLEDCLLEVFWINDNYWYKINDMNLTTSNDLQSTGFPNHAVNHITKVIRHDSRSSQEITFCLDYKQDYRIYGYLKRPSKD